MDVLEWWWAIGSGMGSVRGGPVSPEWVFWGDGGPLAYDRGSDRSVVDQSVQEVWPGVMVGHWIWDRMG